MQWLVRAHLGAGWGRVGCLNSLEGRQNHRLAAEEVKPGRNRLTSQPWTTTGHLVPWISGWKEAHGPLSSVFRQGLYKPSPAQRANPLPPLPSKHGSIFRRQSSLAPPWWVREAFRVLENSQQRRKHQPERRRRVGGKSLPLQAGCVCSGMLRFSLCLERRNWSLHLNASLIRLHTRQNL